MNQNALRRRIATERAIARRVIKDAIAAGHMISINDGEDWVVKKSRDVKAIIAAMFSTDEDVMVIRDAAGEKIGFIHFVYGNDGWDVMSDYTATEAMEALLKGAYEVSDKAERRAA